MLTPPALGAAAGAAPRVIQQAAPPGPSLVAQILAEPARMGALDLPTWDLLVRQARKADVLGRLAGHAHCLDLLQQMPPAPRQHLTAAMRLVQAQHAEVRRELRAVTEALQPLGVPVVLLKGAAYVMAGLPAALGRTLTDIDFLVPRQALPQVEAALMLKGWHTTHHDAYDQRYYRQWMHELPPMVHIRRGTALDVHHAILPLTARWKPDSERLLAAAQPLADGQGLSILCEQDRILHAVTHLLCNDDLRHGLRDLSDIDLMLRAATGGDSAWQTLIGRAAELNLSRALAHGLLQAATLLRTPIPQDVLVEATARSGLCRPLQAFMQALWRRALDVQHPSHHTHATALHLGVLTVRAHMMRMPMHLLVPHLLRKAWKRGRAQGHPPQAG